MYTQIALPELLGYSEELIFSTHIVMKRKIIRGRGENDKVSISEPWTNFTQIPVPRRFLIIDKIIHT